MSAPARRLGLPGIDELAAAERALRGILEPTPLRLARLGGRQVWLKLETTQPTGSFKVRGALAALSAQGAGEAVVACSAGNHGLGIAFAAERLGVPATVVVPQNASPAKLARLRGFDVELLLVGQSYDEAEGAALELAERRQVRFVSPYNDTDVIAGQATMATELLEQRGELAHVVAAVGGGGLAAGLALGLGGRAVVHGVQVAQNAAFAGLMRGTPPEELELEPTIADGIAGGIEPDTITAQILGRSRFDLTLVSESSTRAALRDAAERLGLIVEGSAAAALAALELHREWEGEVCVVLSGGNISDELLAEILG